VDALENCFVANVSAAQKPDNTQQGLASFACRHQLAPSFQDKGRPVSASTRQVKSNCPRDGACPQQLRTSETVSSAVSPQIWAAKGRCDKRQICRFRRVKCAVPCVMALGADGRAAIETQP